MWDKINIFGFGWRKKDTAAKPVQRDISITLTNNGDPQETIHRSPSGTKLATTSSANNTKRGLDDDESSEGSNSLNFGFKVISSPHRKTSFSFTREPLDPATWSNVTSPGFASRLVQQASGSGHSPLKEYNDSLSHSPFRKSPYKDLKVGQLPYVRFSKHSGGSPPQFSSLSSPFKSGASSTIYNRDRRKHARQGQVFVRITPIDPSMKANTSISTKSSAPVNGSVPPRGSPRSGGEQYTNPGLGGIPQQELAMRFNRLWPYPPGGSVPGPGRPISPTSPSNIMEALAVSKKRNRDPDTFYPPNATPPSVSPPTKISVGIGDTPVRATAHLPSKRVKFLSGHEGHDRPMMVPYSGIGTGDGEPLSSESILEQMNQTEKRFLPDSTSTPYSMQKKPTSRMAAPINEEQLSNGMRKRRSQSHMSAVDDEPRNEKMGRFCTCNDCYREAAGLSLCSYSSPSGSPNKSALFSNRSIEKSTNTGEGKSKETCDKGIGTDVDQSSFFREMFSKADAESKYKKSKPKEKQDDNGIMKLDKIVYTVEMRDKDKQKRINRYCRLIGMKPPGGTIFDIASTEPESGTSTTNSMATSSNTPLLSAPSVNPASTTTGTGFTFGSPASTGGFTFGRQSSPVAPTITTSACSTITSSAIGSQMGSGANPISVSSVSGSGIFGMPLQPVVADCTTTPSSGNTATIDATDASKPVPDASNPASQTMFSTGPGSTLAKPKPVETGLGSGGGVLTVPNSLAPRDAAAGPTFGSGSTTTTASSAPAPAFGSISSASPLPVFGGGGANTTNTSGFSFGSNTVSPPALQSQNIPASQTMFSTGTGVSTLAKPKPFETGLGSGGGVLTVPNPLAPRDSTADLTFGSGSTTTTASSAPAPAFGSISSASPLSVFGGGGANTGGFSFGSNTVSTPALQTQNNPASQTMFSTGPGSTLAKPKPFETVLGSGGGGVLTVPNPLAPRDSTAGPTFGSGSTTTTASSAPAPAFGSMTATSPPSVFGGANTSGFSFGSNTVSTPALQTQNNPASQTMFSTGPGSTLAKPKPFETGLGSGGGVLTVPNPLAPRDATAGLPFGSGTTTTTASSAPAPAFGSISSASPLSVFGGGGANTGGFSFGSNTVSTPALQTQNNPASQTMFSTGPGGSTLAKPKPFETGFGSGGGGVLTVPNPLAPRDATAGLTFGSGTTTTTASSAPAPAFGSMTATSPPSVFGGGGANTSGFSFGSNTMSPPALQSQNSTAGFAFGNGNPQPSAPSATPSAGFSFGNNGNPQPSAPSATPSAGFSFGQSSAPAPQPAGGAAVFQFGQQPSAPAAGAGFQFGQQSVPGGFNFASQAPVGGGPPMFNMGSASTAPRRRDNRRRHR